MASKAKKVKEPLKVGLIVGRESTFPQAFIDSVNSRNAGVVAEMVSLGGSYMDEPCEYKVIIDRISHEVPYYRSYLKNAVLQGAIVINNPFWWTADDKYIESTIATKLGVAHPKTVVLPNKAYVEGIVDESLRNLAYPLPWDEVVAYTGLPAFLKPATGGGWKNVYKVHDLDQLWRCYNQTGELTMILQEAIEFRQYVRCYAIGRDNIKVMPYDPSERKYIVDPNYLSKELHDRIVRDCQVLCEALGYDMNTLEFAIRDGVPYAIDFLNPAPDMDYWSVGEIYFDWVMGAMTDLVIDYATGKRKPQPVRYRWDALLGGRVARVQDSK
ncbi:MAG: hypothetical protein HXX08_00785 [Chloroflexi bacterium]|uniref:ATP-grasp domain-containing protein n=1 Tax=Candidatus Chlorohelix allophototropha TaxID=3003348 RepID=A0A8T7LZI5_9CHLR|nr:hypothetical protein [Chloroflexota bacterium]WJW66283.1 hypothetical protein OZ401_002076 [Chloroflexota bacterium L227-S17]